jgi:hypothetical protein
MRFIVEPLFSLRRELSHADLLVHAPEIPSTPIGSRLPAVAQPARAQGPY